jgi:hypothetical protein
VLLLRTQRGSYAPDPDYGVDFGVVQKATPNAAATWRAEVTRALARLVRAGIIEPNPKVTVDTPTSGQLVYQVDFVDARTRARDAVRREVTQ